MSCSLCSQNTDPPTDLSYFQIGGVSPETGVQMCADNLSLNPLSLALSVSFSFDFPPSHRRRKKKEKDKTPSRTETKSHIVHTEQSLADPKLETREGWL